MRAVKIAVVVMGVLIVLGFAIIVVEMIRRGLSAERAPDTSIVALSPSALGLEDGDRIAEIVALGDRLAILVDRADTGQTLLVVDPGQLVVGDGQQQ